jgi:RNA polymerase sigma factor (sigma-70 family)
MLFKELVEQYSSPVLKSAFRIVGNHQCAQDVHQEVFLVILRRWNKFNVDTNWGAYLYRVTVRKAMEFVKRSRLSVQRISSEDDWAETKEGPTDILRGKELKQELLRRLGEMPKRQADVFILSRIEGLSDKQIAEIMNLAPQTVRVHLCRALERLRSELKGFLVER